ncbi:hypothetical protein PHJA_000099100 [Phtheirospermum japonicum]|uniref:Uncharacterized protein n=1 Tax=Phtheirospermum japonicum TaxID=374723 RepID=A0A830AZA9_9LAMI|nr:hypothetical protein PHJA_000099100 [Phtheirospermum japonicum]
MDLLQRSLFSETPLTDLILNKGKVNSVTAKYVPAQQVNKRETFNSKKMIVKAIFQESTNKFLFAEADDNFVEFLFTLLTIPIGGVEHLLGGSTCFGDIDKLYKSLGKIDGQYTSWLSLCKPISPSNPKPFLLLFQRMYGYGKRILGSLQHEWTLLWSVGFF